MLLKFRIAKLIKMGTVILVKIVTDVKIKIVIFKTIYLLKENVVHASRLQIIR